MTTTEEPPREVLSGHETALADVQGAWNRLGSARESVVAAQDELRKALREAFAVGVEGSTLSELMGVSASRVYQLRRGA